MTLHLTSCYHTDLRATPSAMRELARVLERYHDGLIGYPTAVVLGERDALICAGALRRVAGES